MTKKKSKTPVSTKIAAFSMLGVLTLGIIYFLSAAFGRSPALPVLGEPNHVAGAFSFINQEGEIVSEKTVRNKVTVVEYFFTSCPSICPVMNGNLKEVYEKFKANPDFIILSHTVDPERDSVAVLKKYSRRYDAKSPAWQFLTGDKESLYQSAAKDYLLVAADSSNSAFIHTQYVALLDKKRQIRAFYYFTKKENVQKINEAIRQLLKEDVR